MELIFLRHAETDWNRERRYQGRTDTDLSEAGKLQPAHWIKYLPSSPSFVWSSPLARARQTAEALYPGREILIHPGLAEMNLGSWEGKTAEEISATLDDRDWRGLDFADHGGESLRAVTARIAIWLNTLPKGDLAVVVSHKMAITAAYCLATGWEASEKPPERLRFPRAHRFSWDGQALKIVALNESLGE